LSPSVVTPGPTFVTTAPSGLGIIPPITLFTVPDGQDVLIDSVYMVAEYADDSGYGDVFIIRLVDVSGVVLAAIKSGEQVAKPIKTYELTWMRSGVDTGFNAEDFWNYQMGESGQSWWTGCLPEMVVKAKSQVQVQIYREGNVPASNPLLVDQIAITYTPAGGAVSTVGDLLPLLAPIPLEEQLA
jgi:hypothetical protein